MIPSIFKPHTPTLAQVLSLRVSGTIASRTPVAVSIASSAGLRLPADGITAGHDARRVFSLRTPTANASRAYAIAPLGAFVASSVSFGPDFVRAGDVTNISIAFTAGMTLLEHDLVQLFLPDFSGPQTTGLQLLAGASGAKFSGLWTLSCPGTTLSLVVRQGQTILSGEQVAVVIPASSGITLPPTGVRVVQTGLHLSTQAARGPVTAEPVASAMPVGFLADRAVAFAPRHVGVPVVATVSFSPAMGLDEGDAVSLRLAGFSLSSACFAVWSNQGGAFSSATWHATQNPQPSTLNPQPSTLNLQPSTLNPQPSALTCRQTGS